MNDPQDIQQEAINWLIELSSPAAPTSRWEAFTSWLEADPAHAKIYDAVAETDSRLSESLALATPPAAVAMNDNIPVVSSNRWRYGFGALAAGFVAVALWFVAKPAHDFETINTKLGEQRQIALNDGSSITLNGGTTLIVDHKNSRFAKLEAGEALFTVIHDPARPFQVEANGAKLEDLGTVFNVREGHSGLSVAVSQGAIQYSDGSRATIVAAGNQLIADAARHNMILAKINPMAVAGWRQGRLTYQQAPLTIIVEDLTRALGTPVSASVSVGSRRFTGVIQINQNQPDFFHTLETLLGVKAKYTGKEWLITS